MKADMQDNTNALVGEVKSGSCRTQVWVIMLGLLLLCSAVTLIAVQLKRPAATVEKVGTLADFPLGSVTRIQLKATFTDVNPRIHAVTAADGSGTIIGVTPLPPQQIAPIVFLVNDSKQGLLALYARDPHRFGCWVMWNESNRRFEDPCGGSKYSWTGEYIDGPSPRGLDRFGVSVTNSGEILVNVSDYQLGLLRR